LALAHLAPVDADKEEGSVSITGFRGVGPVDIVVRERTGREVIGLIEVKSSVDANRDKIYEAAWDAIKLTLAQAPRAQRWLITGAPESSWEKSEVSHLFEDGLG
jgi:hypothetical protein